MDPKAVGTGNSGRSNRRSCYVLRHRSDQILLLRAWRSRGQVKDARAAIDPFLDPLPTSVKEANNKIARLRGKRLLFHTNTARDMFAYAVGYLDQYREELREQESAQAERRRRQQIALAAKKNSMKARKARAAAAKQAQKLAAAKKPQRRFPKPLQISPNFPSVENNVDRWAGISWPPTPPPGRACRHHSTGDKIVPNCRA